MSADGRDRLWRKFRVPSFEQIIDEDGTLFAAECEVHCGLHIESARFAVGDHEIDREPCACGRATPRLIVPIPMEALRRIAAIAR
jgi:hypothetical protein